MADTTPELARYQSDHDLLVRIDERMNGMHDKVTKLTDDHEERLRILEKEANRFIGRQSMVGALIGSVFALLCALITAFRIHFPS
jgi:hypothetical protein